MEACGGQICYPTAVKSFLASGLSYASNASDETRIRLRTGLKWTPDCGCALQWTITMNSKVTVRGTVIYCSRNNNFFFGKWNLWKGKIENSALIPIWRWTEGDLGFVVGMLWNWGWTREERKDMIADCNPDLGFTAYNSINGIKINTKANSFIFYQNHLIIFQRLLHSYI